MTTTFLSLDLVEEISKESQGNGRYVNPSKIEGEKRLRFVGAGITGFGAWTVDKRPVRWESRPEKLPADLAPDHSGKISVHSREPHGSEFLIDFPIRQETAS